MNKITASGVLRKDEEKYIIEKAGENYIVKRGDEYLIIKDDEPYVSKYLYHLDVTRKSGTVDSLMVVSPVEAVIQGNVKIAGHMVSEYIHKIGVPVMVIPETIEVYEGETISQVAVTGRLKEKPKCRKTHKKKPISTVLIRTDEGTIPVVLWGENAENAEKLYKANDMVTAKGRLQSRVYPDRKNITHTTYELSAYTIEHTETGTEK